MADIIEVDFRKREAVYHWTPMGFQVERRKLELHNQTWHHWCRKAGKFDGIPRGQRCQVCQEGEGDDTLRQAVAAIWGPDFPDGAA